MDPSDRDALRVKVRHLPQGPGVYLMKDRLGTILYVGKAKNLRRRVSSYFQSTRAQRISQPKVAAMIPLIHDLDFIEVRSEPEALVLEGRLIKEWKPRYNTDFVDDKHFPLVRCDLPSPLPRFRIVRFRKDDGARYFGPFPHAKELRSTLLELRRRFGVLLGEGSPRRLDDGSWQLYDDARAELYGHDPVVTEEDYRGRVERAAGFLEGHSRDCLGAVREEMRAAAVERRFERAAELRDLADALEKTLEPVRKFTRQAPVLRVEEEAAGLLGRVRDTLALPSQPHHCECFDISHISGTYTVASMVHFSDGRPDKAQYRRFRIVGHDGNDDFRSMNEVVGRRYARLAAEGRGMPDLVVIDGGRGQVSAALRAFVEAGLEPPPMIGLAKRLETIVFTDEREPLNLPHSDPVLRFLQRMRDEAHRFANTYNADLRSRRLRETILDEIPGMGVRRKAALLEAFGDIQRLRQADEAAIAAVPGIGPRFAAIVRTHLDRMSGGG